MLAFRSAWDSTPTLVQILNGGAESAEPDQSAQFGAFWHFQIPVRSKKTKRWQPWGCCDTRIDNSHHNSNKNVWGEQFELPFCKKINNHHPLSPPSSMGTSDSPKNSGSSAQRKERAQVRRKILLQDSNISSLLAQDTSDTWILPNSCPFEPVHLA